MQPARETLALSPIVTRSWGLRRPRQMVRGGAVSPRVMSDQLSAAAVVLS